MSTPAEMPGAIVAGMPGVVVAKRPRQRPLAPVIRASIVLHAVAPAVALALPHGVPWALAALVGNHAALTALGLWPRSPLLGPNLRRLPAAASAKGEVALTFDDGPDPEVTPFVLDLLDGAGARASFFCIGRQARAHPALVRDIVARGHSVENHSDTHPYAFAAFGPHRLRQEIGLAQASLAGIAGIAPAFFRAPMGLRSPLLDGVLAETQLRHTSWTRRALDGVSGDAARAVHRLTTRLAAGDVLLMHDGRCARTPAGRPVVLEVLPQILAALRARGLTAATLPDSCRAAGSSEAAASSAGVETTRSASA